MDELIRCWAVDSEMNKLAHTIIAVRMERNEFKFQRGIDKVPVTTGGIVIAIVMVWEKESLPARYCPGVLGIVMPVSPPVRVRRGDTITLDWAGAAGTVFSIIGAR